MCPNAHPLFYFIYSSYGVIVVATTFETKGETSADKVETNRKITFVAVTSCPLLLISFSIA